MEERDILAHYGVKGQKWGVRRYQNEDGTLTPVGEKRYEKKLATTSRKQRRQMSDEELLKMIQRLEKETRLKDLEKKNIDAGEEYAKEILKDVGKRVITTAAAGALLYGTKSLVGREFDLKGFANAIFYGGAKKK